MSRVRAGRAWTSAMFKQLWPAYGLASVLILYGFTWGLPDNLYHSIPFNADESAAALAVLRISPPSLNPQWFPWGTALFYQVYLVSKILAGMHLVPINSYWIILMGRVVSYASALGAITLVFLIGRKVFDEWTGRLAATILAVLPGFVVNSHYFKTDIPMTFWLLAAMLAAYQLVSTGKFPYVVLLGLLVGYSTAVKYSAATFIPAGFAAIALSDLKLKPSAWIACLAGIAIGFIIGEPRVFVNFTDVATAVRWVGQLNRAGLPYVVARPPAWLDYPVNVMPYALTLPLLGLTAAAVIWGIMRGGKKLLPVWTFMLCYFLLMANDNTRLVRYTIPLLPFFALLLAFGAASFKKTLVERRMIIPLVAISLGYAFVYSLSYVRAMARVDPRVQASQWIERTLPRNTALPVILTHYSNLPDLPFIGYKAQVVAYSIDELEAAESPYFMLSEFGSRFYREAPERYPAQKKFLDYLAANYKPVARFENSQRLLGVDSKAGDHLPEDWLRPNPLITILLRKGATPQPARQVSVPK